MAIADLIHQETNLAGTLVTSLASGSGDGSTFTVRFFDAKTKAAREPQSTTLDFIINRDNSRAERIKASSHSTASGVTTITIATNGRTIPLFGVGAGTTSGNSHRPGDSIGCVTQHEGVEALNKIMDGTNATTSNYFKVGDGTAVTSRIYIENDQASSPNLFYYEEGKRFGAVHGDDAATGTWYSLSGMQSGTLAEKNAMLLPKNGDLWLDTDDGLPYIYRGGAWTGLTGSVSVPNASTTVVGIAEEAERAEQALGTGTGAAGGRLFINPENLQETSNHANDTTYLSMEYLDDATIQTYWIEAGDSGNPVVDRLDYMSFVGGYYRSAKFPWTFAGGIGSWVGTPAAPQDLSALTSAATGASTTGKVYLWAKTDDHTVVTYFHLRVGSGASDYVTSPALTFSASDTWELKSFSLNGLIVTGTPDWTALNYTFMQVNETGSGSIWLSNIWFESDQEDWGNVVKAKSNDYVDAGMIQKGTDVQPGVYESATDTEISRGIGQNAAFNILTVPSTSRYARGEVNNFKAISGGITADRSPLAISNGAGGRTAGWVYPSDGGDPTYACMNFCGFADQITASGLEVTSSRGIVDGFTGLTTGTIYFASTVAGGMSIYPPVTGTGTRVCLGRAISATEIDTTIKDTAQIHITVPTFNLPTKGSTATTKITTYFQPRFAEINGSLIIADATGTTYAKSFGRAYYDLRFHPGVLVGSSYLSGDYGTAMNFDDHTFDVADPVLSVTPSAGANTSTMSIEVSACDEDSLTFTINNVLAVGTGSAIGQAAEFNVKVWGYNA